MSAISSSRPRSVRVGIFRRSLILPLALACIGLNTALSQDRNYGRSMVVSDHGIVATSHVLTSQAGAQTLAPGGSSMDAAIAANAILGGTEPMMNGIGGDLLNSCPTSQIMAGTFRRRFPARASRSAIQESRSSARSFWSRESRRKCRFSYARRAMSC